MIELIILFILSQKTSNIYGIRKYIEQHFSTFYKVSLGTVHPALKRLQNNDYVTLEKSITDGGQRKSTYSINEKGKEYLWDVLAQDLPDNPSVSNQLIDFKIYFISQGQLPDEVKKSCIQSLIKYIELKKVEYEQSLAKLKNNDVFHKYTQTCIFAMTDKLRFLSNLSL